MSYEECGKCGNEIHHCVCVVNYPDDKQQTNEASNLHSDLPADRSDVLRGLQEEGIQGS